MNGLNNPPAFPSEQHETQDGSWNQTYCDGMSLRDWFAGQALVGFMAMLPHLGNARTHDGSDIDAAKVAAITFALADAMLVESTRRGK